MTTDAHASLTGTDLHEPKGVAAASSGEVYVANGSGSGAWTAQVVFSYPTLHIAGLLPTNASGDATNDITITTGSCRDITDTEDLLLAAGLTKRLDATWAVGDNQGGLDTGSIANTTYHIYLIKRTDTDVVDALFSASASSPTMPANYTKKRRIGSFQRISAAIQTFTAVEMAGGGVHTTITPTNQTGLTANANTTLTGVPTGIKFNAFGHMKQNSGANAPYGVFSPDQTATSGTEQLPLSSSLTEATGSQWTARTNTSGQVKLSGGSNGASISAYGWEDFRRV